MNTSSRVKNSFYNLITGIGGQFIQILLKFVTRTVFIHMLGEAYLGVNGLFTDILSLLSITELGFDTAMNYRLYKPLADKDEKRLRVMIKFYKVVYLVIGIIILALGIGIMPFLKYLIRDYETLDALGINAALIFSLYLLQSASSYMFFAYKSCVVRADQKGYVLEVAQIFVTVISNIVQIVVLVLTKNFFVYTIVLVGFTIITNLVNAVIAQRMYPALFLKEKEKLSKNETIDIFKDCGALFIYKVNGVITRATDNLIVSSFIGIVIVGIYSNYLLIYNTINTLLNRFYAACKASLGNVFAVSDISKSYFFFEVMNFLTFILYGTACVGIAVVSNEFIFVWLGKEFIISQPVAILLGIEILFSGIRNNLGQIRNVSGAFRQMWYRPVMGIIINLVVSLVLVKFWGIPGILFGTILANLLTNFLVDPIVIHKHSFKGYKTAGHYYKKNIGYFVVLALVCMLNYYICDLISFDNQFLSLILHIIVCAITVPLAFILCYWKTEYCQYVLGQMKNIVKKVCKR